MAPKHIGTAVSRKRSEQGSFYSQYARLHFTKRDRFMLSISEALLLDVIDTLSLKTGWCFASRTYLSRLFGLSPRQIRRYLHTLHEAGLLEYHKTNPRQVRATSLWTAWGQGSSAGQK